MSTTERTYKHINTSLYSIRSILNVLRTFATLRTGGVHQLLMASTQGRRPRGTGGRSPQKCEVGTAHALVPPIFREVVLSDSRESMNRVKKVFFWLGKGQI